MNNFTPLSAQRRFDYSSRPTAHRLTNGVLAIIGAVIFALLLCTGHLLDQPTELETIKHTASAAADAKRAAAAQDRFNRAAQAVCGANAAYELLADNSIQCFTHRGFKTIIAKVAL